MPPAPPVPIAFTVTPGDTAPIPAQIARRLRLGVASGEAIPGQQMPSVRALAERLGVNPNTVARAYAALQAEGLLVSQPGRGAFVAAAKPRARLSAAERRRRLDAAADALVHAALEAGATEAEATDHLHARFDALGVGAGSSPDQS